MAAKEEQKISRKYTLNVGTLNLQGSGENSSQGMESGKFEEIIELMKTTKMDILGLQATKKAFFSLGSFWWQQGNPWEVRKLAFSPAGRFPCRAWLILWTDVNAVQSGLVHKSCGLFSAA